jgi:hypothetical protein
MGKLQALWQGRVPLGEAFWTWALGVGLVVNVATSLAFLGLVTLEMPVIALAVGYGVSLPYNALALVGVWRAAARHEGEALHAELARGVTLALMVILSVT